MPIEAKPLFRPDALGPVLRSFKAPSEIAAKRDIIHKWAALLSPDQPKSFREQELLPDFITDIFCGLLGYERPADNPLRYTRSREKYIEVNGKYADAVLGEFRHDVADSPASPSTANDPRANMPGRTAAQLACRAIGKVRC